MKKRVIVVGGGLGAIAGAIYLARLGYDVTLFEKNSAPGGKMSELRWGDYRFDTGPSLLTMPFVIEALFRFAGFDMRQYLDIEPIEPLCRYFFGDGKILNAYAGLDSMLNEIRSFAPGDEHGYTAFMDYTREIYKVASGPFLFTPIHEFRKLLNLKLISLLPRAGRMDPFRTVHQGVSRFFQDPRLIQLFDRYATYNGSNPFTAPAALNIIPWVEFGMGGYYIRGGMYRLVEKLVMIAKELGVKMFMNSRVEKICHSGKKVSGVRVNGVNEGADHVLCNMDVVEAYDQLIDGFSARRNKLRNLEPSLSGLVFMWATDKKYPGMEHHNIFFSTDYQQEFRRIFDEQRAPSDPTIYISVTSKDDAEHAAPDGENWFVLLNMPWLADGQEWDTITDRMRQAVFKRLKRDGFDIGNHIRKEVVWTPRDFYQLYASNRGSIYGLSSNSRMAAFRRPPNRSRDLEGLYFAGGSVHPGGGIPLVLLSGRIAAQLIAERDGLGQLFQAKADAIHRDQSQHGSSATSAAEAG